MELKDYKGNGKALLINDESELVIDNFYGKQIRKIEFSDDYKVKEQTKIFEFLKYFTLLEELKLPEGITKIPEYQFSKFRDLQKIDLPDSVEIIEREAFAHTALESFRFPKSMRFVHRKVFIYCKNLKKVEWNNIDYISGGAFSFTGFETVDFRGSKIKRIEDDAFASNSNLKKVIIPSDVLQTASVYYLSRVFIDCPELKEVEVAKSKYTKIAPRAFRYCYNLEKITLPDNITYIDRNAFVGCKNLKEINMPKDLIAIGAEAFKDCTSLTKLELPEGLRVVGPLAFVYCENLEMDKLPKYLLEIGTAAFGGCKKLDVEVPLNARVYKDAFAGCPKMASAKDLPVAVWDDDLTNGDVPLHIWKMLHPSSNLIESVSIRQGKLTNEYFYNNDDGMGK